MIPTKLASVLDITSGKLSKKDLEVVKEASCKSKPSLFDTTVKEIARRYSGDQVAVLAEALNRRFPASAKYMPLAPTNWLRFFAQQDSGVYSGEVERTLRDATGPLAHEDPRQELFEQRCDDLGLDSLLADCERRVNSGAQSLAVLLGWQRAALPGDVTRPLAQLYWPHQVQVVCLPDQPDQQEALLAVVVQQEANADPMSKVSWVWWRSYDEASKTFGSWYHARIVADAPGAVEQYVGERLPIVFLRLGQSTGFFPECDADICAQVDSLNVSKSNEQFLGEMQAHSQLVYSGRELDVENLIVGPDRITKIGPEETLQSISQTNSVDQLRASRELALREIAVSRSASPDSYSPTASAPASGVARQIANIPHDVKLKQQEALYKAFEERYLLPLLLELIELYDTTAPTMSGLTVDVHYEVKPFESDTEKAEKKAKHQALVKEQLDAGLISKARAAVELDLYPTIDDAVVAGLSNSLGSTASGGSILDLIAQAPAAVPTEGNQ